MPFNFWREDVYAPSGAVIPTRLRKSSRATKWGINEVVGELLREPGYCPHVESPRPPGHIWGLHPSQLRDRAAEITAAAKLEFEPYTRRGKVHRRRQKSTTPIILSAVASWPSPSMERTPERDKWERLVVEAARNRFGPLLLGVYSHDEESRYHLHVLVADSGRETKTLHAGHNWSHYAAIEGKSRAEQAAAYVAGVSSVGDWFHENVGAHMKWSRRSPTPRPRLSRPDALRLRQAQVEKQEAESAAQKKRLANAEALIVEQAEMLAKARLKLVQREAKANAKLDQVREYVELLKRMREDIQDQAALEERFRANRYDDPSVF